MKHKIAFTVAALVCLSTVLTGCGNANVTNSYATSEQLQVVCTIFPEYDWTKQIIGEGTGVSLTLLADDGTDLHSYQPSVQDIATISKADVFCYVGGASDAWVDDVIKTAENAEMKPVSLLVAANADEEVLADGMQEEAHEEEGQDDTELDEHVWLSLRKAELACNAIRDALCDADPDHAEQYRDNCAAYVQKLQELDAQFKTTLEEKAVRDTILVADRFPFRYLADDYDLNYYAAFPGCSAETEASFETIAFLAEKVDELSLPCVLVTESSDKSLANTVLSNTQKGTGEILVLESMQAITQNELDSGVNYLSQMEQNLEVLQTALE